MTYLSIISLYPKLYNISIFNDHKYSYTCFCLITFRQEVEVPTDINFRWINSIYIQSFSKQNNAQILLKIM